ncbi:MAG: NAD/NADP transhydrogenase alpha subunit [Thermobacillus sp. ZCTH02-B1]|uniref:NAD/NADP transhydrogenase alpha subunit n=1 Tax=Thermobacillus sp. ZCTH02-B1 TaxID=1858795 RepID=UPI000B54F451|nr:NAD/NADP transhydrogenase alpha subunit [Thermobacillus sp. ZCTH02-B1]OUM96726.1 MAG: NAD/NADP transhydrogenase alpha subunit [Thermobacillus sp. ZCTH02-B1]
MRCISVYTRDFGSFSDLYERIVASPPAEDEEIELEGITVSGAGDVPEGYIERLRGRPDVVVMRERERGATILQHGGLFEICLP